jgi:AcrR family transcriptional regulator
VIKDSEKTKARLLEAATAEFAEYGIAGARVDRIAKMAETNKAMIYAYFGSKDELFDTAFSAHIDAWLEEVDFEVTDLPGYAGRVFDRFEVDPGALRLSTWYRLERPGGVGLQAVVAINQVRLERLERAQRDGGLATHFSPIQLLALIQAIATSWATTNPELGVLSATDRDQRRQAVVDAVDRLLAEN